jgi:hypothetical protein
MKKIILTAALIFALAAGTAGVLTIQEQPAAAREPCIGLNCSPPSAPVKHVRGHLITLPPVW